MLITTIVTTAGLLQAAISSTYLKDSLDVSLNFLRWIILGTLLFLLEWNDQCFAIVVGLPIGIVVSIGCLFDVVHAFQIKAWDLKDRKKKRGSNSSK